MEKPRLIGELTAQADRAGFTVLLGHCIELGAEGFRSRRCSPVRWAESGR